MSNGNISWLSESETRDMFAQFPLPLAVLDKQGTVKSLNKCFVDSFDASCLKSDGLKKILLDSQGHARIPVSCQFDNHPFPVYIRSVSVGDNTILVFENADEIAYSAELADMHKRIVELERLSLTDRLTGAWNRAHFDRTTVIEISRSVRYRQPVVLVLLDIDHFKQVNDTYGHAIGDEVLRELVKVIRGNIRISDMLFRWGGEEFVVLAPSTSYHSAPRLAETLRSKIEQHVIKVVGNVTVSLGVAEHVAGENERAWFRRADEALYAAKGGGRNRAVVDQHGSSDLWVGDQGAVMIMRLNWHESYNCGEPTIDDEHRQLFELANALIEAAFHRKSNPREFEEALHKLLAHVERHFADEEAILAQHHYAELQAHARAHKKLLDQAAQLGNQATAGGVTIGELVEFLAEEVVARHMLKTDREFYPLFNPSPATLDY